MLKRLPIWLVSSPVSIGFVGAGGVIVSLYLIEMVMSLEIIMVLMLRSRFARFILCIFVCWCMGVFVIVSIKLFIHFWFVEISI